MTQRDKRLIVMLSLIVIIVGFGWWGIRPSIKNAKAYEKDYTKEKDLQEINEMKLMQLPMYQVEADKYDELVKEEQKNFYPIMTSSEIDRHFTDMALAHHLNSYDLSISIGKEPEQVKPYQFSSLAVLVEQAQTELSMAEQTREDEIEDLAKNKKKTTEEETVEEEEDPFAYEPSIAYNSEIYGVNVSMRLSGDRNDLQALIDEISNSEKKTLVRNFVWSEETSVITSPTPMPEAEAEGDGEAALPTATMKVTAVLNINLTLYMCDTSDPTEGMTEVDTTEEE